jgi:hypothetical protein
MDASGPIAGMQDAHRGGNFNAKKASARLPLSSSIPARPN